MKRLFIAIASLVVTLTANAEPTKAEEKRIKTIAAKAQALSVDNCELNDGKKGWIQPNKASIGNLPVYRCTADSEFDGTMAIFTQIPDGSVQKEVVEFCTLSDYYVKCEAVPADRPARRAADLARYGIKERQFEPIVCETTSIGTIPLTTCSQPRVKITAHPPAAGNVPQAAR
ncbi:hypothetical protein E4O92_17470 [Massilia horti]|uniref:Uncharacterized protein n=2 Tax=Massilia horti TaxID=2562153 RepID=A0A4Y9SZR1_9BURK|nr:hypothetical protein E4O92_17470 [Massilia horti]